MRVMKASILAILLISLQCFLSLNQVDGAPADGDDAEEEEAEDGEGGDNGLEELKPAKALMSSTHTKFKAKHCINGKDDGKDEGKNPDMCSTQDTFGGEKA